MRINQQQASPDISPFPLISVFKTSGMLLASPMHSVDPGVSYSFSWPVLASVLSELQKICYKALEVLETHVPISRVPINEEFLYLANSEFSLD